eukprot:GHRR01030996.1.p2 GENE.GHRR01030996.1~~GHRR01030996.1.p2  ORF type:complete len:125 (+),score=38.95 GHRR01030996.1:262-636(+)
MGTCKFACVLALQAGQLGVKLGEEFRAAARAAEAVKASLVLGDRPIEITLERAWAALTWQRRLKLLHLLLLAWLGTSQQQEVSCYGALSWHHSAEYLLGPAWFEEPCVCILPAFIFWVAGSYRM